MKKIIHAFAILASTLIYHSHAAPVPPVAAAMGVATPFDVARNGSTVQIPPGAKRALITVSVKTERDFKRPPLGGFGVGMWFRFKNPAGEDINSQGKTRARKNPEGFSLGVSGPTAKPREVKKTVVIPPNAAVLDGGVAMFDSQTPAISYAGAKFTVESASVTFLPN